MTAVPTTPAVERGPGRAARVLSLAGAEARLLLRNRTAVVNSVLLPLLLVAAIPVLGLDEGDVALGPSIIVSAAAITLVFLTYYNLVTTYVARREELVLQRMRTGELTGPEVLLATAVPTLLVTVGQLVLVTIGVAALGEWSAPVEYVLPLVAVVGGAALMVLLAAASTAFTRTPESAQITTLPLVVAATALSGMFFPLDVLPETLTTVARLLPVTPIIDLLRLGLTGTTWDGETVDAAGAWAAGLQPLAVLAGWLVLGALAARTWFRWAPRR